MIPSLKNILLCIALLALGGCTLVPGSHLNVDLLTDESSYDVMPNVNVRMITPSLLSESDEAALSSKSGSSLAEEVENYFYTIGKGDILNITVWDHPELTTPAGQFRSAGESGNVVNSEGTIFYPYIGNVFVLDMTVGQVRELITGLLSKFIKSPQIDVSVAAFRSQRVFVTGAVMVPSVVPISNIPLTLLDAVNISGGVGEDADWRSVVLTSDSPAGSTAAILDLSALYQNGDMSQNRLLRNNDVVHIPRNDALKVFVMGDVMDPSTQLIGRNALTLAEALNNAGGINEASANPSGIFVLRASEAVGGNVDVFQLDASDGPMLILSTQFKLKPLDIVYVTSAPVARWNRVVSQLLPTFNLLRFAGQTRSDINE